MVLVKYCRLIDTTRNIYTWIGDRVYAFRKRIIYYGWMGASTQHFEITIARGRMTSVKDVSNGTVEL
jgi:hypothetical protein